MTSNELAHHGIKGMKWGVRRFQRKDGSLTPSGKKRYSDSDQRERILKEGGTIVSKGTTFNRVSTENETKANKDRTYLTYKDSDHDYYKQHMTDFRRSYGTKTMWDMSYESVKDIMVPSHEKQVDEFVNLYKNKKMKLVREMSETYAMREVVNLGIGTNAIQNDPVVRQFYQQQKAEAHRTYSSLSDKELKSTGYQDFMKMYSDMPMSKVYQKSLKKQGYNAMRDDNDILYNTMDKINPESSVIVFDPRKNVKVTGGKELTDKEYQDALKRNERKRK